MAIDRGGIILQEPLPIVFLVAGLLFPLLSLVTGVAALIDRRRRRKNSSPVFIPFIGPVLMTAGILLAHYPWWLIPAVWVGDIGTIAFLILSPKLIAEWWDTCSHTRILSLHGTSGNESAQLSFHSTGRYLLRKKWQRPPDECGIVSLGELGVFSQTEEALEMKADQGWTRRLIAVPEGCFQVREEKEPAAEHPSYSVADWVFEQDEQLVPQRQCTTGKQSWQRRRPGVKS